MGELVHFDIEIERNVEAGFLRWPEGSEADEESGLGSNRSYSDLRGLDWSEVAETLQEEVGMLTRLIDACDMLDEYEIIEEERYEDDGAMMGLDIGVAAATAALSAAGCTPFASCNGGAFGDSHHEAYPLVAFCARREHVPLLLQVAEEVNAGLERTGPGDLVLYARDVRDMMSFAKTMFARRDDFSHLRFLPSGGGEQSDGDDPTQLGLFE